MATKKTKPKSKTSGGTKRAAIYVRVSTEKQAEKVSPEAQEADARDMCGRQGYIVTEVYRDTEKYRANGRLVEPSGTRHDRPQLKRMLRDADAGLFDVIIAWREDRLYRGVNRAMLEISERVKSKVIEVELVKEHYDPAIAEVKAWAAGIELQARRDRTAMGVSARLAAGKVWFSNPPYGYDYDKATGHLVVNSTETRWVRLIWQWYAKGASVKTIQQRLIAAGAQQKGVTSRKHVWSFSPIRGILKRDGYCTGQTVISRDDTEYNISIPPIIDQHTYEAVKDRLASYKAYPSGNLQQNTIAAGKVYCAVCHCRMSVIKKHSRPATGKRYIYSYYQCNSVAHGTSTANCHKYLPTTHADTEIWRKVWDALSQPELLEAKINERIAQLQTEHADAQSDCDHLQGKLDELSLKRQQVIAWALAKIISEDDLQMQLTALDWQAAALQKELAEAALLTGDRASQLRMIADDLRAKVEVGRELLALADPTSEQLQDIFDFKRTVIQALVTRADINADKSITVHLVFSNGPRGAEVLPISDTPSKWQLTDRQNVLIALTL